MKLQDLVEEINSVDEVKKEVCEYIKNNANKIFSAKKKQTMQVVDSLEDMSNNSVYQKTDDEPTEVITSLSSNDREAVAKARKGDWIACGANGEKWVIKKEDFNKIYDVKGDTAYPKQIRYFIKVKPSGKLVWKNAWNETKAIPANTEYYIMASDKDDLLNCKWENLNPMDISAFNKTYK